jgi:hypothetical protein
VLAQQPCPCDRSLPVLTALEGRSSDVIYQPGGQPLSAYVLEGNILVSLNAIAIRS